MKRWKRGFAAIALAVGVTLPTGATVRAAPPLEAASEAVVVESDDIRALVAPVALYPDPILALVLQASTLPLQVVQAERFLDKREKDPKLEPDPDWDKSIVALLNYPRQVRSMVEYLDWIEELGNAVVDDLDEVQSSIQEIRLAAYHAGFLKSNNRQKVEVKDDLVRIGSTDPRKVSIPQYDPAALLTAIDEFEEAEEAADEVAAAPPPPPPAAKQAATPAPTAAAPVTEAAAVAPVAYVAEPVAPPAIAYGEPEDSFWDDAAVFAGGAVIGGLLGWGLTEAFDDDDDWFDDNDWDNDDIEDALRDRQNYRDERRDDVQAARGDRQANRQAASSARRDDRQQNQEGRRESREDRAAGAREKLNEQPKAAGGKTRPATAATAKADARGARAERGARDVKLPGAGTQAGVTEKVKQRTGEGRPTAATGKPATAKLTSASQRRSAGTAGYAKTSDKAGIAASAGGSRQVRHDADRGARSRGVQGGKPQRSTPAALAGGGGGGKAIAARGGDGGRGVASDRHRGSAASADGARGRASRGGGGGGRRNR